MVTSSRDILFTVPAGYYLRKNSFGESNIDDCVLYVPSNDNENYVNIYKTYTMIVRKDPNYILKNDKERTEAYLLKFFDNNNLTSIIDCSDGQIRYFNDINANLLYEKGAGLTMDIYACVEIKDILNSSTLNLFSNANNTLGG